jgi:hypothetical protein
LQLHLFGEIPPIVHYFDRNGALHSGYLVGRISRGKRKGKILVETPEGKRIVPFKVRNIDFDSSRKNVKETTEIL